MTIEDSIIAYLQPTPSDPGVSGRIYYRLAPERPTQPFAVIDWVSVRTTHTQCGPIVLKDRSLQVAVFATSQRECELISRTLEFMLDGYSGPMGDFTVRIQYEMETTVYEQETKLHSNKLQFGVMYK